MIVAEPRTLRKAATFVAEIAALEERFGFKIYVGNADSSDPVVIGEDDASPLCIVRLGKEADGALALGFVED